MPVLYVEVEAKDFEFLTHLADLVYEHTEEFKKKAEVRMVKIHIRLEKVVERGA